VVCRSSWNLEEILRPIIIIIIIIIILFLLLLLNTLYVFSYVCGRNNVMLVITWLVMRNVYRE